MATIKSDLNALIWMTGASIALPVVALGLELALISKLGEISNILARIQ